MDFRFSYRFTTWKFLLITLISVLINYKPAHEVNAARTYIGVEYFL